jgi:hypothetical protein
VLALREDARGRLTRLLQRTAQWLGEGRISEVAESCDRIPGNTSTGAPRWAGCVALGENRTGRTGLDQISARLGTSRSNRASGGALPSAGCSLGLLTAGSISGQDPFDQFAHARRVAVGIERIGLEPVGSVSRKGEIVRRIIAMRREEARAIQVDQTP